MSSRLLVPRRLLVPALLATALLSVSARRAGATLISANGVPPFAVAEQSSFSGDVATFTDDNPAATPTDFTAIVDWGDGSPSTAGTISGAGQFSVSGTHTYADEGVYVVVVQISDVSPGVGNTFAISAATVTEADVLSATPLTFAEPQGVGFTATVASFADTLTSALPIDFTATIDWGDATESAGTVSGGSGSFSVSGTHTYAAAGTYLVTVTLSEDSPGTASVTVTSTVHVATGLSVWVDGFAVQEHAAFNGTVATFSDADTSKLPVDFTATIDWGDGVQSVGTIVGGTGSFAVTGVHTYADEGTFSVTVTVTDTSGPTANATGNASVGEADALSGTPVGFSVQATAPFSGTVATFTDTDTVSDPAEFIATIGWGDATISAGTVSGGSGSFTVSGSHTYAWPGTFAVTVTLTDDPPGTATATAASTATVGRVPAVRTLNLAGLLLLMLALAAAASYLVR
jgi:PKD repeat protein